MSHGPHRISRAMRWAIALKAALLLALAAIFWALVLASSHRDNGWFSALVRVVCVLAGAFAAWSGGLGLLDALTGRALRSEGAVALASRRSGHSLRLSDGRFVEFILHNPWEPLRPGRRYTVTYGARSRVLVEPPVPEE